VSLKIAILKCDEVLTELQPQFGRYEDMIQGMFDGLASDLDFNCFDCQLGEYPEDLQDYDLYITTGSRASAYEDKPWISELIRFTRELDRAEKKTIGICFGHQIMAMVLGGRVEKSEKGWGIGVAVTDIIERPNWMKERVAKLRMIVSHRDQVTSLPEGARVLAGNDFCPFFIVQWNDHFLSIQGHPEWQKSYSRKLINSRRTIIPPQRVEEGLTSLHREPDNPLFVRWILDFVNYH
jgi:GMP synthase-like glutamine amidotransferase